MERRSLLGGTVWSALEECGSPADDGRGAEADTGQCWRLRAIATHQSLEKEVRRGFSPGFLGGLEEEEGSLSQFIENL